MPRVCHVSDAKIIKAFDKIGTIAGTAQTLGVNRRTVRDRVKKKYGDHHIQDTQDIPKPKRTNKHLNEIKDTCQTKIKGDNATIVTKSRTIKTAKDAIAYAEIDTKIWQEDTIDINSWEVAGKVGDKANPKFGRCQLWQVKVKLKRRAKKFITDGIDSLFKDLKSHKPKKVKPPKSRKKTGDRNMLEISLFDAHFGKYCWGQETREEYDAIMAGEIYQNAVEDLLHNTSHCKVEKILYPVGSDFFHVNNWANTTARGTPQDTSQKFSEVFDIGCKSLIQAIDTCLEVAPVELLWVPGNHDRETSYYMCKVLEAWYNDHKDVNINISPQERKYVHYGATLLGFTHGDEEKHHDLPSIMAGEEKKKWASTIHREWHLGHYHKKKETRYNACDTYNGVQVTILPSLSGTDKWHFQKGYVNNVRSAIAYLWNYERGFSSYYNAYLR
jgi:hypothetical protein